MASRRAALVSICHGAGPLPVLGDPSQEPLIRTLSQDIRKALRIDSDQPPKAIAVLTAHWQTKTTRHKRLQEGGSILRLLWVPWRL